MKLTLGLYGLYLLLVAIEGNGSKLTAQLGQDMGHFLPWLIVAAVLGGLYDFGPTQGLAGMFILLVALSFVLMNFTKLKAQFSSIYSGATATTSGSAGVGVGASGAGTLQAASTLGLQQ
jgi:hypothetical protein